MCTVSIKVNDNLLHRAWANMDKDVDMAEWMQQQIEAMQGTHRKRALGKH